MAESFRPLIAIGGMAFVLFGVVQLMANQFGFDRDGFRVFVLSSARRRDILMGKNLSFAPLVMGMATIMLGALQTLSPMRWDHFLAMIPQSISMYLLFCLLMNFLSIYGPVYVAAGSLKPTNPKLLTVLLHLVTFMVLLSDLAGVHADTARDRIGRANVWLWQRRADLPSADPARVRRGRGHLLFRLGRAGKLAAISGAEDPGNGHGQSSVSRAEMKRRAAEPNPLLRQHQVTS